MGKLRIGHLVEAGFWLGLCLFLYIYSFEFDKDIEIYKFGATAWPRAVILLIAIAAIGVILVTARRLLPAILEQVLDTQFALEEQGVVASAAGGDDCAGAAAGGAISALAPDGPGADPVLTSGTFPGSQKNTASAMASRTIKPGATQRAGARPAVPVCSAGAVGAGAALNGVGFTGS